ncbi:uncharacterized protein LOC110869685 [Helianthus annuus]|uniref:uncharacterized protein LOC110869685 n=1 Tax=Helianthus annuus TaxID=4232 RepID=UPI001652C706|nr:uncharacterized protein LOC110869685 [Helianthus annuus]
MNASFLDDVLCNIVCNIQLAVRPFVMLEASFAFHAYSRGLPNGLVQYVCGLKLIEQAGTNRDEVCRLWPTASDVVSNSIQARRCSHTLPDGKVQTYFGLTLINSCNDSSIVGSKHSIHIQNRTYVGLSGKVVTYCGPTLTTIDATTSSADPNAGCTQIQPPTVTVTTGTDAKVCTRESIKGRPRAHVRYQSLGRPTFTCHNCAAIMWYEERNKNTKSSDGTTFSSCCQDGKVLLARLLDPPEPLRSLLDYNDPETLRFREHIRVYNSMFCFTSFGGKIDHAINSGRSLYTFRISGQNYHRIGSMLPVEGEQPRYAQLYFYDTQNEVKNRITALFGQTHCHDTCDEAIVASLIRMLDTHSPLATAFRMARDWCTQNERNNCQLRLLGQIINNPQYNRPNVSEVAVLITNDFGDNTEPRDVIYPLLFPYGETGFHERIHYHENTGRRATKRQCVTMREYYCYRIHYRNNEGITLLRGGRLFQQYLVDSYAAIEEQRLRWMRNNQNELRVELYHNVCDAVTRGDTNAEAIGQRIVLPATFTGSPRYMIQNYQDAMALCRTFGNPDLFVTFTANPKWPEIEDMVSLIPGQKSHDRADVVSRVFKLKLTSLIEDIMKKQIFGSCQAAVYTIEFQKRGLPHAHLLLWLEHSTESRTPAGIDDLISAEIPSKIDDPSGYKAVTDYMLHGPCGNDARSAPCTTDRKCMKHFPKPFYRETTIDEDGYPVYRRRDTKIFFKKGKTKLDNRFVVPYNRYLLLKYESHINVEWCNQSRAIKYLFKYLNKGPDRATMVVQENIGNNGEKRTQQIVKVDEIKNYLDCRYLSPCGAVWRMLAFPIHYSFPSVMKLTFHTPNQHLLTLRDSDSLPALLNRDGIRDTMFTQWFALNNRDEAARELTYAEILTRYVWQEDNKVWKTRLERTAIGRIVYCNPAAGPKYYLRMLLGIVRGPRSFEEIKTVDGVVYATFKEACYAYGLLNDDKEWNDALSEAKLWASGSQLRELFVTMLLFCEVNRPAQLWAQNWEILSDDILYLKRRLFMFPGLHLSDDQLKNYCLIELNELLEKNGKSLSDFTDMPQSDTSLLDKMDNRLIREELIIDSVTTRKGGFYFVYGPGGTGKTFLYKAIMSRLRSMGMIALAVASSGIASLLLPGGRTTHSRFAIPLELLQNSTCAIKQNTQLAHLLQEVRLIIWDEAPMMQKYAFEALDKTLRDILGFPAYANRERVFGGMPVLLGGDFRQILPVIPKGKREDVVQACINKSYLWKSCKLFRLHRSMRVNEYTSTGVLDMDRQRFNKWLLEIGDGIVPSKTKEGEDEPTWIEIPTRFIVDGCGLPVESIVNAVFPSFTERQVDEDFLCERAILTPRNIDADEINDYMFAQLRRTTKTYKSSDERCRASTDVLEQEQLYPSEFLNSLTFPGMPPHALHLKEGLPVMLLRNVNPSQGLCNGTRLIITDLGKFVIKARILTGSNLGDTALIPRITLSSTKSKWPFIMKRRQFPVKPCYAMTINKSQGQSLKVVGLYLPRPVFSHGQLYVTLSRVTTPEGLKIVIVGDGNGSMKNHTRNIVYKETFNNLETSDQTQ